MRDNKIISPEYSQEVLTADTLLPGGARFQDSPKVNNIENSCKEIKVSLVSNSRLLDEGLISLLSKYVNLSLLGTYYEDFPAPIPALNPTGHVVILDGNLTKVELLHWINFWRNCDPQPLIILIELNYELDLILTFIEAGINGYTLKGVGTSAVATAIKQASAGQAQCSPEVTAELFARLAAYKSKTVNSKNRPNFLTSRELEIIKLIAADYSNRAIAENLAIEVCTVKHHVHNILEKLKMRHRQEVAHFALEQGF